MLGVWLLALASGWANACVLQDRVVAHADGHLGAALVEAANPEGATSGALVAHDEPADHDDGARALCQSVCDDAQSTLPRAVAPSVPDLRPPALVPTDPWACCAAQAQFPSGCPLAAAPPPQAPVAIRYLRLTI